MSGESIVTLIAQRQDIEQFRKKNWVGSFAEYLDLVKADPRCTRNAFQRVYDMVTAAGSHTYEVAREKRTHYRFFDDPDGHGRDAIFGLEEALEQLVNAFKSAARGYGIEKRVLLLHGPVGSSKSTIARLLKQGAGSRTVRSGCRRPCTRSAGHDEEHSEPFMWCPMNEEPLHLGARPLPSRMSRQRPQRGRASRPGRLPGEDHRANWMPVSAAYMYAERLREIRRRLDACHTRHSRQANDPQRAGSRSASARSSPKTKRTRTRPS